MQISRKVDANITLTKDVLAELQWANNAELTALVRDLNRAYGEAVAIGGVTPRSTERFAARSTCSTRPEPSCSPGSVRTTKSWTPRGRAMHAVSGSASTRSAAWTTSGP